MYGLLQACGTPSVEHDHMLKRSARHAMSLLKFLVCDFVEDGAGGGFDPSKDLTSPDASNLNLFAQGFCSLPPNKYKHMSLDLHVVGDQRGGAKEDACYVMTLLLVFHVLEDGETSAPMSKEELLATVAAQQAFAEERIVKVRNRNKFLKFAEDCRSVYVHFVFQPSFMCCTLLCPSLTSFYPLLVF